MSIREKILESTEKLFVERGIKATKLDDVAADCKVSKKTIYNLFISKDELVLKLFENKVREIEEFRIAFYNEPTIPFTQKLVFIIKAIKDVVALLSLPLLIEVKENYPEVRKILNAYIDRGIFDRFGQLYEDGMKNGYILETSDFEDIAHAYRDAIYGILDLRLLNIKTSLDPAESISKTHITTIVMLFRGMLTSSAIESYDIYTNQLLEADLK